MPADRSGLLLVLLLPLSLIVALNWMVDTAPPDPIWRITQAERALVEDGAAGTFQPVSLPDRAPWRPESSRQTVVYRLDFVLPDNGPRLWALLVRKPYAAVKVWINGELLADSGVDRLALPEYRYDVRYNVSPGLLRAGANQILIQSVAATWRAGLGEIWLGDSGQLARYKAARNRVEKDLPSIALQVIVGLAVILGGVYLVRRQEPAFGWFSGALLLWALHTHTVLRNSAWLGSPEWSRPVAAVALAWFVVLGMFFVHRLLALHRPRLERAAVALIAAGSVLIYLPSLANRPDAFERLAEWLFIPLVLAIAASVTFTLMQAQRRGNSEASGLLLLAGTLLVIGIRDWIFDLEWIGGPDSMRYLPFAAPLVFVVFGGMLLRRHVAALNSAEAANRDLESKVRDKTAEIERNWRHIASIERERARFDERDRLMRDMHDGVGGHLVQALSLASAGQSAERIAEAVQAGLDDLRLLIDASDIHVERLTDVLARFRERMQRRLGALGIDLIWDFTSLPELPALTPERTVHLLRILQEWLTNSLKHAAPTRIELCCQRLQSATGPDRLLFEYRDDGPGLPTAAASGRGLLSLQQRARALGGELTLLPGAGFGARLHFPLRADEV